MVTTAKSVIDSLREVRQDILVPELKALRVSVDSMRTEMQLRDEKTQESVRHLDQRTQESIRHLDERTQESIRYLSDSSITRSISENDWLHLKRGCRSSSPARRSRSKPSQ
jgi:hypothetical protein